MSERYIKLAKTENITTTISRVAKEIIANHPHDNPLFVALLRGAMPFASKLMIAITHEKQNYHPDLDYMLVSTYGNDNRAGEPRIVTDIAPSTTVENRNVIIVDDVLDKGITAEFVTRHFHALGATSVELAVLAEKNTDRIYDVSPDYCGFSFGDKWLVGMGMDDPTAAHEGYRWLDEIWEART